MVGLTKKREEELPAEKPGVTTSTGLQVLRLTTSPPFPSQPFLTHFLPSSNMHSTSKCVCVLLSPGLSADLSFAADPVWFFADFWQIMFVVLCASLLH